MNKKFYQLYCEICNWKLITDGIDVDKLHEIKTAPIPQGAPKIDPIEKKVVVSKPIKQKRKFRCPSCGRVVTPKPIKNPQETIDRFHEQLESEQRKKEWEKLDAEAKDKYEQVKEEYEREQKQKDQID